MNASAFAGALAPGRDDFDSVLNRALDRDFPPAPDEIERAINSRVVKNKWLFIYLSNGKQILGQFIETRLQDDRKFLDLSIPSAALCAPRKISIKTSKIGQIKVVSKKSWNNLHIGQTVISYRPTSPVVEDERIGYRGMVVGFLPSDEKVLVQHKVKRQNILRDEYHCYPFSQVAVYHPTGHRYWNSYNQTHRTIVAQFPHVDRNNEYLLVSEEKIATKTTYFVSSEAIHVPQELRCLACQKNPIGVACQPCGHLCCATCAPEKRTDCPVCKMQDIRRRPFIMDENGNRCVCHAYTKNTVFLPCQHLVCCEECSAYYHDPICPLCGEASHERVQI